ncbi:MAG: hypothetical protein PW734_05725 [Verrucomicrobium sp.]|nr:hypothetical protein [Verrucomicrobium sp.]
MIYHRNPLDYQTRRVLFWTILAAGLIFFFCVARWQQQTALPPLPSLSEHHFASPGGAAAPADGITGAGRTP